MRVWVPRCARAGGVSISRQTVRSAVMASVERWCGQGSSSARGGVGVCAGDRDPRIDAAVGARDRIGRQPQEQRKGILDIVGGDKESIDGDCRAFVGTTSVRWNLVHSTDDPPCPVARSTPRSMLAIDRQPQERHKGTLDAAGCKRESIGRPAPHWEVAHCASS